MDLAPAAAKEHNPRCGRANNDKTQLPGRFLPIAGEPRRNQALVLPTGG
jgi:hypothetical protein